MTTIYSKEELPGPGEIITDKEGMPLLIKEILTYESHQISESESKGHYVIYNLSGYMDIIDDGKQSHLDHIIDFDYTMITVVDHMGEEKRIGIRELQTLCNER